MRSARRHCPSAALHAILQGMVMRWVIRVGLALFTLSTLWLVLSGTLGERLDASRAAREAAKAAAKGEDHR